MTNIKSNSIKKQQGTLKKSRIKSNPTYAPIDQVPDPAFKLSPAGQEYFRQFCSILLSNKTLTLAYVPIITRAARWYEIYVEADKGVQKDGAVQVTSTGYTQKSGYMTAMADADDRITKIEEKFGLNLAANLKMDIPKQEKENPFDNV